MTDIIMEDYPPRKSGNGHANGHANGEDKRRHNGANGNGKAWDATPEIYTAAYLQTLDLPKPERVIGDEKNGDIIPEGSSILAAPPKHGKSCLMADIGVALASGGLCLGDIKCDEADVLYLALEDSQRIMRWRLDRMLGVTFIGKWPRRLHIAHEWPRAPDGLDHIENWIGSVKRPKLVIVDVLANFRPRVRGKQTYDTDYEAMAGLRRLTGAHRGLAGVAIHHTRKAEGGDDPLDAISGTQGLGGAADSEMVLRTKRGGENGASTSLYGRGRFVEEFDKAMSFDKNTLRWSILGNRNEVQKSEVRQKVIEVLAQSGEPLTPSEIGEELGQKNIRQLLRRLKKAGEIRQVKGPTGRTLYVIPGGQGDTLHF